MVARWPFPILLTVVFITPTLAQGPKREAVETILNEALPIGRLDIAKERLVDHLAQDPQDSHAQYGLGLVSVLESVRNLGQNLHRYGLRPTMQQIPILRLPVPENPNPEPITHENYNALLQQFIDDLSQAARVLEQVTDDNVKLKVKVGMIRLDLDGNGHADEDETFWKIFTSVAWRAAKLGDEEKEFPIGFDRADVH
ncbi:MAG: hypothetical protein KDA84_18730, partial [Planctomycetaceae bacterium]|nr:hypothetical protein [Planctomycetaceae bacterium]